MKSFCLIIFICGVSFAMAENGKQNEKGAAKADHAAAEAKNEKGHEEGHDKGHGKGMGNWHEFGGEILSKCQEEEHASKEDIESIKKMQIPTSENGKCIFACILKKLGLFENGQVIAKHIISYLEKFFGKHPFFNTIKETIPKCASETKEVGKNRCDAVIRFILCCRDAFKNAGFSMMKASMPNH